MKLYKLERKQFVPISAVEAWEFFSAPENLNKITPSNMSFEILFGKDEAIYSGQIISYNIKPLMNKSINWVTEITHVNKPHYFVDEQRFGPYKFWHHKHFIKEISGGVELSDIVHYSLPYGIIGRIFHKLFIRKKLDDIFNYRVKKINQLFNTQEKDIIV